MLIPRLRAIFLALSLVASFLAGSAQPVSCAPGKVTAREFFSALPISIFESTTEGLSWAERDELLEKGATENWEIVGEDEDIIVFASLPLGDTAIALHLFRDGRSAGVTGIIGTIDTPICVTEGWRLDASGRLFPVRLPDDPSWKLFFDRKNRKLPPDTDASVVLCLGYGGLKAHPIFWADSGMISLPVDNTVRYLWDGRRFKRVVTPVEKDAEGAVDPLKMGVRAPAETDAEGLAEPVAPMKPLVGAGPGAGTPSRQEAILAPAAPTTEQAPPREEAGQAPAPSAVPAPPASAASSQASGTGSPVPEDSPQRREAPAAQHGDDPLPDALPAAQAPTGPQARAATPAQEPR